MGPSRPIVGRSPQQTAGCSRQVHALTRDVAAPVRCGPVSPGVDPCRPVWGQRNGHWSGAGATTPLLGGETSRRAESRERPGNIRPGEVQTPSGTRAARSIDIGVHGDLEILLVLAKRNRRQELHFTNSRSPQSAASSRALDVWLFTLMAAPRAWPVATAHHQPGTVLQRVAIAIPKMVIEQ